MYIIWGSLRLALTDMHLPFHLQVDPFHTLFGLAGLSLLGNKQVKPVNPVFCMPEDVIKRLGLKIKLIS